MPIYRGSPKPDKSVTAFLFLTDLREMIVLRLSAKDVTGDTFAIATQIGPYLCVNYMPNMFHHLLSKKKKKNRPERGGKGCRPKINEQMCHLTNYLSF